jgi:small conductance mechanosensitive channel
MTAFQISSRRRYKQITALAATLLALAAPCGAALAAVDAAPAVRADFIGTPAPEAIALLPETAPVESLRVAMERNRREVRSMESDAETALGADAEALRLKILELRFESVDDVDQLVDAVLALDEESPAAGYYRDQLITLLPRVADSIHAVHQLVDAELRELKTTRASADPAAFAALDQHVRREDTRLGRLLAIAADHLEMLASFELDPSAAHAWLSDKLYARARLESALIHLETTELEDARELADANTGDATLQTQVIEANKRLQASSDSLAQTVGLLERLEFDASGYKQLLIASSGEITTDIFDEGVASQLISGWISNLKASLIDRGPQTVFQALLFALVVGAAWMVSRFVRRVTERAVASPNLRLSQLLKRMIVSASVWAVLTLGLLVALSQLGFQVGPMLAGLGIAGFVLGFALQDTLSNFAAGIMLLVYRPYDVGDLIDCAGGVFGKVSAMSLVTTTVLTVDNQTRIVPNGKIWGDVITNVSAQRIRRVDLSFGIGYGDNIEHAENVLWSIVKEHPKVLSDPEPVVKLHELGDSSVNFVVRPWVLCDDYWDVYWDFTREVKLRFDREGISIPFPQSDVHFYPAGNDAPLELSTHDESKTSGADRTALSAQDPPDDV